MKQFYETYCDNEKLSPLVRVFPWTNNLLIMAGCKTDEAREFYLRLCIANRYTKRELDRQIGSMLYERTMLSNVKHKELIAGNGGLAALRDSYVFEFLDLEEPYKEKNPLVLCTGKDDTVVEYALNRTMSPTMVADYTLHLPDKTILQNELRELTELALESADGDGE